MLLENYDKALQAIYDHVGFVEDWVVYPIDDKTDHYWTITENGSWVRYAKDKTLNNDYYEDEIYTQRFYKKHVYEGEEYTMIFCDPHTDRQKWFRVFRNSMRVDY